jgi:hypothetical protein
MKKKERKKFEIAEKVVSEYENEINLLISKLHHLIEISDSVAAKDAYSYSINELCCIRDGYGA